MRGLQESLAKVFFVSAVGMSFHSMTQILGGESLCGEVLPWSLTGCHFLGYKRWWGNRSKDWIVQERHGKVWTRPWHLHVSFFTSSSWDFPFWSIQSVLQLHSESSISSPIYLTRDPLHQPLILLGTHCINPSESFILVLDEIWTENILVRLLRNWNMTKTESFIFGR